MARLAMGHTKFHDEMNADPPRIPPPDGWLGPRSPVWTEETVLATIKSYVDRPRPPAEKTPRKRAE